MLSKKHFERIAQIIKSENLTCADNTRFELRRLTNKLTDYFAEENPRFDKERFLLACGVKE